MANANNEPDFTYRIYLQEQLSMDLHSNAGSVLLDSAQQEMLTQIQGDKFVDIGNMSRESLVAWVYGVIDELKSFELHRKNLGSAVWSQLYKIIKNHDVFKDWIYSRPRTDASGFVISLRDYSSHPYYSSATVLGYCHSVWQKIEHDLRDENPTRFMKELFQQVFNLWHFKYCINNILRELRGVVPNRNLANSRPDPGPANIQIDGHSFNVANFDSSLSITAAVNNQGRGWRSTYASRNAHNSQIANVRGKKHINTSTALGQNRLPKVKNMSEVSKQGVEYQAGSSPTDDAIQTTEPSANASEGSNIKQEVENEHNHGEQAEGRPKGCKQYIQQIIGAGRNQLVQMTAQSNSRVPSKSTKNAEEIRKRSAPVGSDNGAVLVPVQANKKTKVEKKDPALAGHSSS